MSKTTVEAFRKLFLLAAPENSQSKLKLSGFVSQHCDWSKLAAGLFHRAASVAVSLRDCLLLMCA